MGPRQHGMQYHWRPDQVADLRPQETAQLTHLAGTQGPRWSAAERETEQPGNREHRHAKCELTLLCAEGGKNDVNGKPVNPETMIESVGVVS